MNSLATFQMIMDDIFEKLITEGMVVVYLDNILIFMETIDELRGHPTGPGDSVGA